MWGKPPVSGDTTPRHEPGTGREQSRNTPLGGKRGTTPLGGCPGSPRATHETTPLEGREAGNTRWGPPGGGLAHARETRFIPNPGPLGGPGSLWKLPQSERKPDRDMISTRDKIPPEFYPGKLKNLGISPKVLVLGKSCNLGSLSDFSASARDGRGSPSSGRAVRDAGQGPLEARA